MYESCHKGILYLHVMSIFYTFVTSIQFNDSGCVPIDFKWMSVNLLLFTE